MRKRSGPLIYMFAACLLLGLLVHVSCGGERVTSEKGQFSLVVPDGYASEVEENTGRVTLRNAQTLSKLVQELVVETMPEEDALDAYDDTMSKLKKDNYRRKPRMRMLKKNSLKTALGIDGWELCYLIKGDTRSAKDVAVLQCLYLLDHGADRMIRVTGMSPYDRRVEFFMLCDELVNRIEVVSVE